MPFSKMILGPGQEPGKDVPYLYHSAGTKVNRPGISGGSLALEGEVKLPRVVPPQAGTIAAFPTTFVDYFRVRIDPTKSGETDSVLRF